MSCCSPKRGSRVLDEYAKALQDQDVEGSHAAQCMADAAPLLYPMYTSPMEEVLKMTKIEPHEVLKEKGIVAEFDPRQGKGFFVSHQWVGGNHPDPHFQQFQVLQDTLRNIMSGLQGNIPLDPGTQGNFPSAKSLPTSKLRSTPLFVWYDYFSCPQLENKHFSNQTSNLAKAVESIPAYVERCAFFFVLCPVIESPSLSKLFSPFSWAQRGWCRVERFCRELCLDGSHVFIKSSKVMEVSLFNTSLRESPGEGTFTVPADRDRLGPVLMGAIQRKILALLKARDFVRYRLLLNSQTALLRGFDLEAIHEPVPWKEEDASGSGVSKFLYQNGLSHIMEVDAGGWAPLHYAALRGDSDLIQELLAQRADLLALTQKDCPTVHCVRGVSALAVALAWRHNEAASLLISAKAPVGKYELGMASAMDNAEGVRMLCEAGCSPHQRWIFNVPVFLTACQWGSLNAMKELYAKSGQSLDLSQSLFFAIYLNGGRGDVIQWLIDSDADVNELYKEPPLMSAFGIFHAIFNLQHRLGNITPTSKLCYHTTGRTPLMTAVMTGNYEAAAVLVAAGARVDLRTARGLTAAGFAEGQSVADFLVEAFKGDPGGCVRATTLAIPDHIVVEKL